MLARLVSEGLVRRILRGVYAVAQLPDTSLVRAQALALATPGDAVAVDWTACWLHTGVARPGSHLALPPVSMYRLAGQGRLRNRLCVSGERALRPDDVMVIEGVVTTTPLRTALDLGRLAHRDLAIGALDALLRHGDFTTEALLDGVARFRGQRGVVQLRALAPLADPRAESPGESVLRLRWLDIPSLPRPLPQVPVRTPDGFPAYWIDLGVEELRFGVEYDGEEHHTSEKDRAHDRERRKILDERHDWLVKPATKQNVFGVTRDVERILHEGIREARQRRGRFRPGR